MSAKGLAAWRRRYYRVDARVLVAREASDLAMVRHAIKKWSGLDRKVLRSFGLEHRDIVIRDVRRGQEFTVNNTSCALCLAHRDCKGCPLSEVRGFTPCDEPWFRVALSQPRAEALSPWHAFSSGGDTRPMIRWLERMLRARDTLRLK